MKPIEIYNQKHGVVDGCMMKTRPCSTHKPQKLLMILWIFFK